MRRFYRNAFPASAMACAYIGAYAYVRGDILDAAYLMASAMFIALMGILMSIQDGGK